MSHCACAEATEWCGFDRKIFLRKFCLQGKSFNPAPQIVLELYNTLFRGVIHPRLYARRVNTTCENKFGKFIVMYFAKEILVNTTKELEEKDTWLQHLPIRLKSPFPNDKTSLLDYVARFASLVRHDCLDN